MGFRFYGYRKSAIIVPRYMPTTHTTTHKEEEVLGEIISEAIDDTQALARIRPDLNIEKWSIWQPSKSKLAPSDRVFEREVILPDGSKLTAYVEIGFTGKGTITTEDQKTYYALVKCWEDEGCSTEFIPISLRELAKLLMKKWGTNVIESLTQSLTRLRVTPIIWRNSYYDSATGETIEELEPFTILSKLKIFRRKKNKGAYHGVGYFQFDEHIITNLSNNHTKPLLFDTAISFKSEIAQLLYPHVDLVMADKYKYERRTKGVCGDLGLQGKMYAYLSGRKRAFEPALAEMEGKPLSTGVLVEATLVKTSDGKDYKVVFVKKAKRTSRKKSQATVECESALVHELYERGIRPEVKAAELVGKNPAKLVEQWLEIYDLGLIQIGGLRDALEYGWQPSDEQLKAVENTNARAGYEKIGELEQDKERIKDAHVAKCEAIFEALVRKYPQEAEKALRAGLKGSPIIGWYDESKSFEQQRETVKPLARPALRERFADMFKVVDEEYERQVKEIEKRSEEIRVG